MPATGRLEYYHVDVFTPRPFSGNSLAVFPEHRLATARQMRLITQELRHFESIFLTPLRAPRAVRARVFDLIEELDFAGHPLLGAAAVLHERAGAEGERSWTFELNAKTVEVTTERRAFGYTALLDQGRPEFLGAPGRDRHAEFAAALNLDVTDLSAAFAPEVVSTGLRYLVLPIDRGLDRARIVRRDFDALLASVGAQFVYVLDVGALEGRHWNNDGLIEDVATGSGAGTVGAYLLKHRRIAPGEEFILQQGRFVGRPSRIRVRGEGRADDIRSVSIGGDVSLVGQGVLHVLPDADDATEGEATS